MNAYLNTNTSHLGAFGRKAGPPCNTNPLSPSGKSLSQRSYMDFPKLTHEKKKILRTFYFGGGFLQSRRRSGNNYSDTPPPPVVEGRRATHRQHGPQREQLLRASPVSAVQVLPFLQDVLLPLETGLAVAHPAGEEGGREGGGGAA